MFDQFPIADPDRFRSLLIAAAVLYFVPTIIAWARGHHNAIAITWFNLLLGVTGIGWVLALVWSTTMTARQWSRSIADAVVERQNGAARTHNTNAKRPPQISAQAPASNLHRG